MEVGTRPGDQVREDTRALLAVLDKLEPSLKGREEDLRFLRRRIASPVFDSLMKVHEKIGETDKTNSLPLCTNVLTVARVVSYDMEHSPFSECHKLYKLLTTPHFYSLVLTHDKVANREYPLISVSMEMGEESDTELVRIDKGNHPMGATVKADRAGNIIVSRVLYGSMADKTGLLHPGDVIHEVNGNSIHGLSVDDVADMMAKLTGTVVLKISPAGLGQEHRPVHRRQKPTFMRALFSYNPDEDEDHPCKEAGLQFSNGDVLKVVNRDDAQWWQASLAGNKKGRVGLVPSAKLREKNMGFRQWSDRNWRAKGKREVEYSPLDCEEQGITEMSSYEEVIQIPPQTRRPRPLVFIAPKMQPFDINELKARLVRTDSKKFCGAIQYTSRPIRPGEENAKHYYFVTRNEMRNEIQLKNFIEHSEYDGHFYGLSINTVREVMNQGKVCLLVLAPRVLKFLHGNGTLMPFVIYFKPPSNAHMTEKWAEEGVVNESGISKIAQADAQMQSQYRKYFDLIMEYDSLDGVFVKVQRISKQLLEEPQWVPASWHNIIQKA